MLFIGMNIFNDDIIIQNNGSHEDRDKFDMDEI